MANGLDKLERFFSSKRKASTVSTVSIGSSTAPSSAPGSPTQPTSDLSFPSPSFIRPKTSRMAAREEFRFKGSTGNTPTSPHAPVPGRNRSTNSNVSSNSAASRRLKGHRPRSSSLDSVKRQELASVFRGFEFPKPPPSRQEDAPSTLPDYASKELPSLPGQSGSRPVSPLKISPSLTRLSTPPSSDPEDIPLSQRRPKARKLQIVPHKSPPTPESSPEMGPVSDWQLRDNKPGDLLNDNLYKDTLNQSQKTYHCQFAPQSSATAPDALPDPDPVSEPSLSGGSLHEPGFDEFLNLSDDNVAECDLQEAEATPNLAVTSLQLREPPLLTLGPPCASRAAKAAAFEAARIASRYNFDMIYVVNLWPEDGAMGVPPLREDPGSSLKAMTGRLLAAYGLHNVPSPFQIAAEVHLKVLRSEGWLEYRDEQALGRDFGRAYACSFYPGKYEEKRLSRSSRLSASPKMADPGSIDRGIVFAAYRKPKADGSIQYSTPAELACLHRDVEAMVEMLIDIHVANRLRQSPILTRFPDETGPIPATTQVACA